MHTHASTLLPEVRTCVYVCALHNAGVEVSRLIFYLSGLITIAFTAALLHSVEDIASLLKPYWGDKKKAACLQSIQGSHKMLQLQTSPVLKVFYSIVPQCRKQQKQISSVISDIVDVSLL